MNKVRFGLIGFGAWGRHHARAITECAESELVCIAARSPATQAEARTHHPATQIVSDYRELLARPDIDVVDVVLPTDLHHEIGSAVLRAGKHLLLEKPMSANLSHCDDLIKLAQENQKLLAIGHEFRLSSLWGKVKEMIDAGAIGEPQYALIELWRNPYRQGAGGWRYDINRVGNWILEEPIHFFDLARWYFSKLGNPQSVYARANARRPDHPELQDNFSAIVNFPCGAYAVISQTLSAFEHHQVVKITGTKGALWATWSGAFDRTFHPTFSLKHLDGDMLKEIPITKLTGEVYELVDQIQMVSRAIHEGTALSATGEDGKWSVQMCLKAQESVNRGCVVGF
jgi:myo-inositol 2-dehydrogenase / D-chiro-inositol 1-dehydrogenase